uniref:Uncharacterized protein n=1 Tax=Setaria viridis TaxID=4556 RepID=A0A4U6U2J4_SETVI|nr:hypothetical protein SEVIR_6G018250v2 [Setaria viridis]
MLIQMTAFLCMINACGRLLQTTESTFHVYFVSWMGPVTMIDAALHNFC